MKLTQSLVECLQKYGVFDTKEGKEHRLLVLGKLNALVKKWIYEVSIEKVRGVSVGVVGVLLG
jgi:poly(A) polymerase Pap1